MSNDMPQLHAPDAGVLLGTAFGDALGAPFETTDGSLSPLLGEWRGGFLETKREGQDPWPAGATTDDTGMALALAHALVVVDGEYDRRSAAYQYLDWYQRFKKNPRGIGNTTRRAMENLARGVSPGLSGIPCEPGETGNGPAMRAAPIGLAYAFATSCERARIAGIDARITHLGDDAAAGSFAVAEIVARVATAPVTEPDQSTAIRVFGELLSALQDFYPRTSVASAVTRLESVILSAPEVALAVIGDRIGTRGEISATVATAIYCALRHLSNLQDAVRAAVLIGGDTDTRAAITGAVVTAYSGNGSLTLLAWRIFTSGACHTNGPTPNVLRTFDASLLNYAKRYRRFRSPVNEQPTDRTTPKNRSEAVAQITQTGFTIPAMLAVGRAFPLDSKETHDIDDFLARLRQKGESEWADGIEREIEHYISAWRIISRE